MTRTLSRKHVRWIVSATGICLAAAASCRQGIVPTSPRVFLLPIAELANEKYAAAPRRDSLGGPYGRGRVHPNPRPGRTRLAPARIDASMRDSVLVDYLNDLRYEMRRDRTDLALLACKEANGVDCPDGESVPVFIQPELGMNELDPATITERGVVVARIINFDTRGRSERFIGFPPASRTWWYVYRDGAVLRSRFFTRTHNPGDNAVAFMDSILPFRTCPNHGAEVGPAMAKWADCNSMRAAQTGSQVPVGSLAFARRNMIGAAFVGALSRPRRERVIATDTWIKCMANCCSD